MLAIFAQRLTEHLISLVGIYTRVPCPQDVKLMTATTETYF